MYYTVAYPKKFKGVGGGGKSTHSSSLETIFFTGDHFCHVGAFWIFFILCHYGHNEGPLSSCVGGGEGFLVLSGDLFGFAPPPATAHGEKNFRAPKIIKIYLLILKCRIVGLNIFLIFDF